MNRPANRRLFAVDSRAEQRLARLRAFDLFEAVQSDQRHAALRELGSATSEAERRGWHDVAFVLAAASIVHALNYGGVAFGGGELTALVKRAEGLDSPASLAMALGLRAVAAGSAGDSAALIADAARAVALADEQVAGSAAGHAAGYPAGELERCVAYVIAAAAFNALQLWELVDDLYGRAIALGSASHASRQNVAVRVNRVLIRLEWALATLERGDDAATAERLERVTQAVPAALEEHAPEQTPELWRRDVLAAADVVRLLRCDDSHDLQALLPCIDEHRLALERCGDLEVLPTLEAAVVLALWRCGRVEESLAAVADLQRPTSASTGVRGFPRWVRAQVLAGAQPSAATAALADHLAAVGEQLWESRRAVLAAARAQIAIEKRKREHEMLSREVETDSLTGLSNRRIFDAWLRQPILADRSCAALLLVDIDDFKTVNDTFGHDIGDRVLRAVADTMVSCVRAGDIAIRHGGDEFALILEGDQGLRAMALERAERLVRAIREAPWAEIAPGLQVRASVGVAAVDRATLFPDDENPARVDAADLYRAADAALYRAKRAPTRVALAQA